MLITVIFEFGMLFYLISILLSLCSVGWTAFWSRSYGRVCVFETRGFSASSFLRTLPTNLLFNRLYVEIEFTIRTGPDLKKTVCNYLQTRRRT